MQPFYVKLKICHTDKYIRDVTISVKTNGNDAEAARHNVKLMVQKWTEVKSFEVLKISKDRIIVEKYIIKASLKLKSWRSRDVEITVYAENKIEAKFLFNEIIDQWHNVVSRKILEIVNFKNQNYAKRNFGPGIN